MKMDVKHVDNVVAKSLIFECKGDFITQHVHKFDHIHLVGYGEVEVFVEGEESKIYKSGDMINIKALKAHKIISVSDFAVSYCIHALKDTDLKDVMEDFEKVQI